MSNRDRSWLNCAIRLALRSTANKRHGCIIIKGGRVIGYGYNSYINKPFFTSPEHLDKCSIHAEIAAIRNSSGNVKGATVYVARVNNRGEVRYSEPCDKCRLELDRYGIRKAIWTT